MGINDARPREGIVRTGAELARLAQSESDLAAQLVERARAEGVNLVGENGLLKGLVKLVLEGALESEMADHLGYEKGDRAGNGSGNSRNGTSRKRILTDVGAVELDIPATGPAPSARRSCPSTSGVWKASTRRSCPSTPRA
ncbi:Transposase, Mutator family [Streptomyces lavendulae subsp. lavendulae]|uniref:Mutator family transposase n=1 Tax=Streptomyces lavendulae subsp. lavendulae TaxID=58340 RepID=A0A2K8PSW9_STRLA|nr:transposase [Streptomyces lavendulae]ATZ29220.1 Transposase, Mutator family [Streptomyces lavendulae subsp. lavendulae]QUQ59036.1 hypothetical protein SLLC_35435 [Streptomyces lavendulae subsp. lavendulae]